ncbi:hypothetical protein, partial [Pseudomonas sp. GM102]|uniref:hypothetical protein n=1 Tax=Pseudomonas sp. GM102 TaxID=1144321 RepID=UPI001EE67370
AWGETFWVLLGRLPKVPRRKGETISRRYRSNGYVHHQPKHGRPKGRHRNQDRKGHKGHKKTRRHH